MRLRFKRSAPFTDVTVDLNQITLLTGINSSGKSTILNAIGAVLQTPPPQLFPFQINLNGENCSLGSYREVVKNRTSDTSFSIGFCATHDKQHISLDTSFRYSAKGDDILPHSIRYKFNNDRMDIIWESDREGYLCCLDAPSFAGLREDKSIRALFDALSNLLRDEQAKDENTEVNSSPKLRLKLSHDFFTDKAKAENFFPIKDTSPRDLADRISSIQIGSYFVNNINGFMRQFGRFVGYVGPIRAMPLRYYSPDQQRFLIDPQGVNCAQLLRDWKRHSFPKYQMVVQLLTELELIRALRPHSTTDDILKKSKSRMVEEHLFSLIHCNAGHHRNHAAKKPQDIPTNNPGVVACPRA